MTWSKWDFVCCIFIFVVLSSHFLVKKVKLGGNTRIYILCLAFESKFVTPKPIAKKKKEKTKPDTQATQLYEVTLTISNEYLVIFTYSQVYLSPKLII